MDVNVIHENNLESNQMDTTRLLLQIRHNKNPQKNNFTHHSIIRIVVKYL